MFGTRTPDDQRYARDSAGRRMRPLQGYASSAPPRAFTLVELLVVVGLMAVLIALLLPALGKARRQAQQVACLSNLRHVTAAFLSYAQDNRGWFPASANGFSPPHDEDWVHWQPGRDITESRLYRYLGNNLEVLKCPAGTPERARVDGRPTYPFNYTVNIKFTGDCIGPDWGVWAELPCKLSQVVAASLKVLVIDEDVGGINDGSWMSAGLELPDPRGSSVSVRHDRGREYGDWRNDPDYVIRGRGNAGFADGHCEFIPRLWLLDARHILPAYRP